MRRRDFIRGSSVGLAALAAPRVVSAQANRVLRYKPNNDLTVIDPIYTSVFVTRYHANAVFDTLYGQDNNLNPHPQMVDGHVIENDDCLWRLKLRDGLKFHDGERVLARDAVASIRRWARADAFGQALMAATDELDAPSDNEIRFRLRRPFPLLPAALGKSSTFVPAIMPERLAKADISRPLTEAVGSGPYRFVASERVIGQRTVYEKFAGYVPRPDGRSEYTSGPKIAYIDRVEWRVIPDQATAAAALRKGEIDWFEDPISDLLPMLRGDPGIVVETINKLGNMGIVRFNHLLAPFDNPQIRRAAARAVSQTEMMQAVAGDTWSDDVGFFCPESPMASTAGLPIAAKEPDYAAIKRELAQAGYKGETITLLGAPQSPGIQLEAEILNDQLRRAGMNVDFVPLDFGNWLQRRNNREAPERGGWNALTTFLPGQELWDPAGHLALRGNKQAAWSGWPDSPKLEALRDAWFAAGTEDARKAICRDMQLQAIEDVPYVPSGRWTAATAYRKGLTNVSRHIPLFYNLKLA
jgi:peptide/nickel transport system substrate-binding protein